MCYTKEPCWSFYFHFYSLLILEKHCINRPLLHRMCPAVWKVNDLFRVRDDIFYVSLSSMIIVIVRARTERDGWYLYCS